MNRLEFLESFAVIAISPRTVFIAFSSEKKTKARRLQEYIEKTGRNKEGILDYDNIFGEHLSHTIVSIRIKNDIYAVSIKDIIDNDVSSLDENDTIEVTISPANKERDYTPLYFFDENLDDKVDVGKIPSRKLEYDTKTNKGNKIIIQMAYNNVLNKLLSFYT